MDNHHFTYPKVTPVPRPTQVSTPSAAGTRPPLQDPPRSSS
ncbi:MAG: hypothetical protein JWP18_100 [Solirubrobacterales bacterium]|jgi:hypothetical protein|nr:hypothetical protein [Solirubrobacterales bacterium]